MTVPRPGYTVGLLVDHVTRDLNVCAYVANMIEACGSGGRAWIDHLEFRNRWRDYDFFERTRRTADLLVLPSYNVRRTPSLLSRAVRHGARMVMNHSEQIFAPAYDREKLNLDHAEAYRRRISAHLVWGEAFARRLVEDVGVDPSRVYVVGNAKLDLGARLSRAPERDGGGSRPTALFVSDFRLGDFDEAEWRRFKRDYRAGFASPLNRIYREARVRFVEWIRDAAPRHREVTFLVRPHPGEDPGPYRSLRDVENVDLGNEGEFAAHLRRAGAVFQFTSTSIFESLILGKSVYNLAVAEIPTEARSTHHDAFEWIDRDRMHEILDGLGEARVPAIPEWKHEVVERHMHRPAGNSLLRTVVAIDDVARSLDLSRPAWRHPGDRLAAGLYAGVAALKYAVIRSTHGAARVGLRNPVDAWSRRRWEAHRAGPEWLDDDVAAVARERLRPLTAPEEIDAFCGGSCVVRQEEFARAIELPPEAEARRGVTGGG
jgi:surface carbohydrate biosynthesis protein